jgi:hypothetical protein
MRPAGIPRKRPVNWPWVKACLRRRRERRELVRLGFKEVRGFARVPWEDLSYRIVDTRIANGGHELWVRVEEAA